MLFTADHDEPRRILQKFIAAEINPYVDEWEKAEQFPSHELFKKLGDLGFLGLNKPVEFGGQGLDYSYALMMAEELGALSLIHISEPTRQAEISYAVFCLKKKK